MKFALKVIDLRDISYETNIKVKMIKERLAASEPKLMMLCDSPNVMKCYDIYENKDLKILVLEYCDG
jgi:serine/threonine protein kinase